MPQTYGVNIFLVHQINVDSVMLGIETVFGRPYKKYPHFLEKLPSFLDRLLNCKSQCRMNGSYEPGGKYDTSPNENI